jgi:hypothetical protein
MTVTEPLVASLLGVTVLGESLGANGPQIVALVAAVAVTVLATTALARGEAATMTTGETLGETFGETSGTGRLPVTPLEAGSPVLSGVSGQA